MVNKTSTKKILFSGSRNWPAPNLVENVLRKYGIGTPILVGDSYGVDEIVRNDRYTGIKVFKADWNKYGKSAGPIRNKEMLDENPDMVYIFRFNNSKGSTHVLNECIKRNIPYELYDLVVTNG